MGRGLSKLQKQILGILYERRQGRDFEEERRQTEQRLKSWVELRKQLGHSRLDEAEAALANFQSGEHKWEPGYDAFHAEVLAELYGWPVKKSWWRGTDIGQGSQNFDRKAIGLEEYNAKTASYYRAVARLMERGLVEKRGNEYHDGLFLTDEGVRAAKSLTVSRV